MTYVIAFSWEGIQTWMLTWLPLIFMGMLVCIFLVLAKNVVGNRTKPQEIKPDSNVSVGWDDVAGVQEAKDELKEIVDFLRDPDRFRGLGATVPKGVLLHGPPGTGKTLLAKAAAREAKANFYAQSASAFVEMFVGLGSARIRRLFKVARKNRPAIIFIDELDAVGATRGNDVSGEKDQTLNQLLVEMDGFGGNDDVVVIAASNLIEKLDPALLRPGRFDRQIFVSPPDLAGREEILGVHSRNKPLRDVDLELIARQTAGLAGADLANICNEAAIFAGRAGRTEIITQDFEAALERVIAGMESRRVMTPHEKRIVAYHEAGHAMCRELLPSVEKLHKVSIVPRGHALGYAMSLPEEDRYLKSKKELTERLVVVLGGRVAEQVVFGSVTTGASDDLKKANEISRAMVAEYGMGNSMSSRRLAIDDYAISDNTRRLVDEEQADLTDVAYRHAHRLIEDNRQLLDTFAQSLLDHEVLERSDIDRIMGEARIAPLEPAEPGPAQIAAAKPAPPVA